MIYVDPGNAKIIEARENFKNALTPILADKISLIREADIKAFFDFFISPMLNEIIIGKPQEIYKMNRLVNPLIQISTPIKNEVNNVFDYDWFIRKKKTIYDAYNLAEDLGITSCVYCNRNYTNTIISQNGRKISRAQLDHYFDRSANPLLALSFYNLIPSCSTCNSSIKHSSKFDLSTHNHPYIDDKIDEILFSYEYNTAKPFGIEITVKAKSCAKTQRNIEEFALKEVYNAHTDILSDLLKTKSAFSERYLSILRSSMLKGVILSDDEMYRIVFGTEKDSRNFVNRPFSKFKNDLLIELGIKIDL